MFLHEFREDFVLALELRLQGGDPLVLRVGGPSGAGLEGGGAVLGSFLDAGQVDEVDVFLAPVIEGGSHSYSPARGLGFATMAEALRLDRPEVQVIDGDVRVRGTLARAWRSAFALDDPQRQSL